MRYRVQALSVVDTNNPKSKSKGKWPEVEIPDNAVGLTVRFDFGVWYFGWLEPLDQPVVQNQQLPKAKLEAAFKAGMQLVLTDQGVRGPDAPYFEEWFAETYPEGVGVMPVTK